MTHQQQLSIEQQFNLRTFKDKVQKMSREQAQQCLIDSYQQMLVREEIYKNLLKHQWGIEPINGGCDAD